MTVHNAEGARYYSELGAKRIVLARELTLEEAVSYTHLRAHETVLDLVCRLLLEKKKPSTTLHDYITLLRCYLLPTSPRI